MFKLLLHLYAFLSPTFERYLHTCDHSNKYFPEHKFLVFTALFFIFVLLFQFELIYFDDIFITQAEQYRWYQVLYQVGVFISRSSINVVKINAIWVLAVLQVRSYNRVCPIISPIHSVFELSLKAISRWRQAEPSKIKTS